jgi:hypothetical protein
MIKYLNNTFSRVIFLLAIFSFLQSAVALQQTNNDRTPTWVSFKARALEKNETGAFFALGMFCSFPEQFPPKRPNPRWDNERPLRQHFVEKLNPAFLGCFLKPVVAMPEFFDFKIPAEMQFNFEKSLPSGFEPFSSGTLQATLRSNFAENRGRIFKIPELQGSPDQQVIVTFSIFGKKLTEISFIIDSSYTLNFYQYDRATDDQRPYLFRQWLPR